MATELQVSIDIQKSSLPGFKDMEKIFPGE